MQDEIVHDHNHDDIPHTVAGTKLYCCSIHPHMKGKIIVQ